MYVDLLKEKAHPHSQLHKTEQALETTRAELRGSEAARAKEADEAAKALAELTASKDAEIESVQRDLDLSKQVRFLLTYLCTFQGFGHFSVFADEDPFPGGRSNEGLSRGDAHSASRDAD